MVVFRRLAIVSTVTTLVLVGIGGLVRATKSGLGCGTDWPHCNGRLAPALETRAEIIEFSHRAVAGIAAVLITLLALAAIRYYRRTPKILWAGILAAFLVFGQALLGALVVKLELEAESVVLHLTIAMSLVAVLIYILVATEVSQDRLRIRPDRSLSQKGVWVALSVLALLLVGSYVGSYPDRPPEWPLIGGRLIPDLSNEFLAAHFTHRALAAAVGLGLLLFAVGVIRERNDNPLAGRLALLALGGFVVEIVVGAANVWTDLNAVIVTLHLLSGALIWGSLVALAAVTSPALARVTEREPVGRTVADVAEGRS